MFLNANYDDLAGQVIAEGEYEVVISTANQNVTQGGTEFLDIQMKIRQDIMQQHQNQMIFYRIWKKKQPTDADPGGYVGRSIQQMSKAVLIPDGAQIATLDAWLEMITNRPIRVKVKHEMYNDNKQVVVAWTKESNQPQVSSNKIDVTAEYVAISNDEDAPF